MDAHVNVEYFGHFLGGETLGGHWGWAVCWDSRLHREWDGTREHALRLARPPVSGAPLRIEGEATPESDEAARRWQTKMEAEWARVDAAQ